MLPCPRRPPYSLLSFPSTSFSFPSFLFLLPSLQTLNSLITVTINGTATGANNGVYTAYLCSAGKYKSANIPGLKKAREARVRACAECRRMRVGEVGEVV